MKDRLPTYTPPATVWERIAEELSPLREVEKYAPPASVWDNIEGQLDERHKGKNYFLRSEWLWKLSVAASISVFVVALGWWFWQSETHKEQISYSVEHTPVKTISINHQIDAEYERIKALCSNRVAVCETPDFRALQKQLDELTVASQRLQEAIGDYNTDEALAQQLEAIEQQRSQLLQQLTLKI
ncbi:MAG: hypothetical protein ACK4GN_00595 [Runella sp.]